MTQGKQYTDNAFRHNDQQLLILKHTIKQQIIIDFSKCDHLLLVFLVQIFQS